MTNTALLIIDVQNAMFAEPNPIYDGEQLLSNLQELISKARTANVPVIYVQHNDEEFVTGTQPWEIQQSIAPNKGEVVVQKTKPDSFYKTDLNQILQESQIKNLIIAGNQTEYCVDTTCRRAVSLGYQVILVKDAHRTWNSYALSAQQIIDHHNEVLGNAFVVLKKTEEIQFSI
jgi:nicotinamidase-related amidase